MSDKWKGSDGYLDDIDAPPSKEDDENLQWLDETLDKHHPPEDKEFPLDKALDNVGEEEVDLSPLDDLL